MLRSTGQKQDRLYFNQVVDARQVKISEALGDRIALLRGIAGLFAARNAVTNEEFQMYAAHVQIRDYPDIRAIGYSARVRDVDTDHYQSPTWNVQITKRIATLDST